MLNLNLLRLFASSTRNHKRITYPAWKTLYSWSLILKWKKTYLKNFPDSRRYAAFYQKSYWQQLFQFYPDFHRREYYLNNLSTIDASKSIPQRLIASQGWQRFQFSVYSFFRFPKIAAKLSQCPTDEK
jgi:hypothetical protein